MQRTYTPTNHFCFADEHEKLYWLSSLFRSSRHIFHHYIFSLVFSPSLFMSLSHLFLSFCMSLFMIQFCVISVTTLVIYRTTDLIYQPPAKPDRNRRAGRATGNGSGRCEGGFERTADNGLIVLLYTTSLSQLAVWRIAIHFRPCLAHVSCSDLGSRNDNQHCMESKFCVHYNVLFRMLDTEIFSCIHC